MIKYRYLLIVGLMIVGCSEEDPSTSLQPQPTQRDMARGGGEPVDMFVAPETDMDVVQVDAMMNRFDRGILSRTAEFGELIFTEIMYDPDPLEDDVAEWIEVQNVSTSTIELANCVVEDRAAQGDAAVPAAALGDGILEPLEFILLARNSDPMLNGGLTPDVVFAFSLSNGGDELVLTCGEIEVDVVEYDDGDTFPNAKGVSIVRAVVGTPAQERWCPSTSVYDELSGQRGTPGAENDICEMLMGDECWAQIDCADGQFCMSGMCGLPPGRCQDVDDCDAGELCVNGGCELEAECSTNEECDSGQMCVEGNCVPVSGCAGDAECAAGEQCVAGMCQADSGLSVPALGDLIVSEFMYDPHGPVENRLQDDRAEWIEIVNVSMNRLDLSTCTISDGSAATSSLAGLVLEPAEYALGARSTVPEENGQLAVDFTFDFALNNSSDLINISCGEVSIDSVSYSDPTQPAQAYQRSAADLYSGPGSMPFWCGSTTPYLMEPEHFGTPGLPNEVCP